MRGLALRSEVTPAGTVEVSLVEVPVDEPGPDEVVVRVAAAPVNPSDLNLMLAGADVSAATTRDGVLTAPLPPKAVAAAAGRVGRSVPVGAEGAGTVVAAGSSDAAQELLGSVVSMAGLKGVYAQYALVDAAFCLPLPEGVGAEDGAAGFVNPLTALGMLETMRAEGHTALVHTAAASNLGQMLNRLCRRDGVGLVNVVRSPEQAALLAADGAEWVCDTSAGSFDEDLRSALAATGATLAFDAVGGGELAGRIVSAMDRVLGDSLPATGYGSSTHKQVYLYGHLDPGPTVLANDWGMAWGVGGWLLGPFLARVGPDRIAALRGRVVDELTTTFASRFTDRVDLATALRPDVVAAYARRATGRKYLITP